MLVGGWTAGERHFEGGREADHNVSNGVILPVLNSPNFSSVGEDLLKYVGR